MPNCHKCNDTGVIETGNNDLPCDCPASDLAVFNVAGVNGPITGRQVKMHFLNDSPQPFATPIDAETVGELERTRCIEDIRGLTDDILDLLQFQFELVKSMRRRTNILLTMPDREKPDYAESIKALKELQERQLEASKKIEEYFAQI